MKTRIGSEIQLLGKPDQDGWVLVKRIEDGEIREWHVSELKAETREELELLMGKPDTNKNVCIITKTIRAALSEARKYGVEPSYGSLASALNKRKQPEYLIPHTYDRHLKFERVKEGVKISIFNVSTGLYI